VSIDERLAKIPDKEQQRIRVLAKSGMHKAARRRICDAVNEHVYGSPKGEPRYDIRLLVGIAKRLGVHTLKRKRGVRLTR